MITETQIIEAAKAMNTFCQTEYEDYTHSCFEFSEDELTKFAQHFYRQGLLDAAEKCDDISNAELFFVGTFVEGANTCTKALRQMAEEIK